MRARRADRGCCARPGSMRPRDAARRPSAAAPASHGSCLPTCLFCMMCCCFCSCMPLACSTLLLAGMLAGRRATGAGLCALEPPACPLGVEHSHAAPVVWSVSWVQGSVQGCSGGRWRSRAVPMRPCQCAQVGGEAGGRRASWPSARQARGRTFPPPWRDGGWGEEVFQLACK
jgi:hypothetical protein